MRLHSKLHIGVHATTRYSKDIPLLECTGTSASALRHRRFPAFKIAACCGNNQNEIGYEAAQ